MKMIDDAGLTDDPLDAANADRRLVVRFSHEKRLNHAANTVVAQNNLALEEKAVLLDHAHKFDEAKATRAEKLPDDPIYRTLEFVSISIPGDNTMNVHRPVMASDKTRFRRQYEAFKTAAGEQVEGTPIALLPEIAPGTIKQLEYVGVTTIEQIATLADSLLKMMGGVALKQKAAAWVAKNRKLSVVNQTNEALAERDAQIAKLMERLEALEAKPAKTASK